MVPPLRSEGERRELFEMVASGRVSLVASDHAPHTIEEKLEPVGDCPPGIPGLETTLPLFLTVASRGRLTLSRIVQLLSKAPARIFGLRSKGELIEGKDGDVVLVDLNQRSRVDPDKFLSKARYTPFEGTRTVGAVATTIVGGRIVYQDGQIVAKPGSGRVLRRS